MPLRGPRRLVRDAVGSGWQLRQPAAPPWTDVPPGLQDPGGRHRTVVPGMTTLRPRATRSPDAAATCGTKGYALLTKRRRRASRRAVRPSPRQQHRSGGIQRPRQRLVTLNSMGTGQTTISSAEASGRTPAAPVQDPPSSTEPGSTGWAPSSATPRRPQRLLSLPSQPVRSPRRKPSRLRGSIPWLPAWHLFPVGGP